VLLVNVMVEVPGATPVTLPGLEVTVALVISPLTHVPPAVFVSTVTVPGHTVAYPPIAAGNAFTVTIDTFLQPVDNV
jgi:hypothetical protein